MRRLITGSSVALLALIAVTQPLRADASSNVRIAVLDIERVRLNAAAVKGIRAKLGTYLDMYRADTQKEEQEIRIAQEELARKRSVVSHEDYAEERKKLEDRLADAQGRVQRRRQALERVNVEAMERVKQALETIVAEVAADRQLTLIIRKDQAVFASPEIEITDDVMKRLDQRLPSVQVADPGG
jgi:Skp family chaperone for outer membrane proteins